jgi:Helicase conserved C-terminal domain
MPQVRIGNPTAGHSRNAVPPDVTGEEADLLADWLLEAPGAIIARTLRRHGQSVATDRETLKSASSFTWRQLRPYLGQRYFASTVLGRKRAASKDRYPEALRRALLEGGFEATLDEHVAVMMLIGNDKAIDVLRASLLGRSGFVRRRPARGRARRVPVHVAVPYLGAERHSGRPGRSSETLRSDLLRRGFNSPFWPYVLSTTSIGQEGLDFHVWCDRVIHWDLPRDPVDFEQREGRISRYAGLGVRRSLAQAHGAGHLAPWQSPFTAIFKAAQEVKGEGLGIERWWSPPVTSR